MVRHTTKINKDKLFEKFVLIIAIIEPLSTVPQIVETFISKNAVSLSLLSWLLFMAASVIWLLYGIKTKSMPLIASSILWTITEIALVVEILLYS